MNTSTLSSGTVAAQRDATSATSLGSRWRAVLQSLAAWNRRRRVADRALHANREFAELSAHVLRDIGVRDSVVHGPVACVEPHGLALDFEIRG